MGCTDAGDPDLLDFAEEKRTIVPLGSVPILAAVSFFPNSQIATSGLSEAR